MIVGLVFIPLGLPGTFVILGAAFLYALATGFVELTWGLLGVLFGAALFAEAVEAAAGVAGAKKYGAGGAGMAAAFAGGLGGAVMGAPIFFGLGALPGALIGAFAAAVLAERFRGRPFEEAMRAGWGTFLGKMAGTVVKSAVGLAMAVICLHRIFS